MRVCVRGLFVTVQCAQAPAPSRLIEFTRSEDELDVLLDPVRVCCFVVRA